MSVTAKEKDDGVQIVVPTSPAGRAVTVGPPIEKKSRARQARA
jgi:hypothetical protein